MNTVLLDRVLSSINGQTTPGAILDLACGTGDLAVKLARKGFTVTAVDFSDTALKKAKLRASVASVEIKFLNIDFNYSELKHSVQGPFNLIFCKLAYAFIIHKERFLNDIKTLISRDGSFILIAPMLYQGIDYDKRLKSISSDYEETKFLLEKHFKSVTLFAESFFEENGVEAVFIAHNHD